MLRSISLRRVYSENIVIDLCLLIHLKCGIVSMCTKISSLNSNSKEIFHALILVLCLGLWSDCCFWLIFNPGT